jgi:hypothetical protein
MNFAAKEKWAFAHSFLRAPADSRTGADKLVCHFRILLFRGDFKQIIVNISRIFAKPAKRQLPSHLG